MKLQLVRSRAGKERDGLFFEAEPPHRTPEPFGETFARVEAQAQAGVPLVPFAGPVHRALGELGERIAQLPPEAEPHATKAALALQELQHELARGGPSLAAVSEALGLVTAYADAQRKAMEVPYLLGLDELATARAAHERSLLTRRNAAKQHRAFYRERAEQLLAEGTKPHQLVGKLARLVPPTRSARPEQLEAQPLSKVAIRDYVADLLKKK